MRIKKIAAGVVGTVLLLGFGTGVAQAKHGSDDPAGHHRHSAGDDHGRHHRHGGHGADDGVRHDAGDDRGHRHGRGHGHGGHGADD